MHAQRIFLQLIFHVFVKNEMTWYDHSRIDLVIRLVIGLGYQTQARYSVAFPFLRWGIFLPMGTEDFRKFLTSLIFKKYFFLLSINAIIKQCNIHIYIYSISNLWLSYDNITILYCTLYKHFSLFGILTLNIHTILSYRIPAWCCTGRLGLQ